eukprot:3306-Eustigmatos_ZCMA.PRE.1
MPLPVLIREGVVSMTPAGSRGWPCALLARSLSSQLVACSRLKRQNEENISQRGRSAPLSVSLTSGQALCAAEWS